jgi:hypothetical protein
MGGGDVTGAGGSSGAIGQGGAAAGTGGSSTTSGGGQAGTGGSIPTACSPADSACQVASDGNNGLCDGQTSTCADCVDPTDDSKCASAYGSGHLCIAGSCVTADCRTNADCTTGKEVCGGDDCQVSDPVSDAVFIVDPVNGDDQTATGSGTAGGSANAACSFKTVTAAINAVNQAGTTNPTTIQILGPSSVGAGETWPLQIPSNTTITASGGAVVVVVPSGQTGFGIGKALAGIDGKSVGITIDGGAVSAGNTAQHGVVTATGSDTTDFLTNVTIKGFSNEAILVNTGGLTIKSAVTVTTSGQPPASFGPNVQSHAAVRVGDGAGVLVIDVPAGQTPTTISRNTDAGIQVQGLGKLTITGVPGAQVGSGTVVVQGNPGPGIEIENLAQAGSAQCSIDGVVAYQNGSPSALAANTSSGIRIVEGANVRVRSSVTLGNGLHGIHVAAGGLSSGGASVANIDLGGAASPGLNVVQNDNAQGNININGVGICFETSPGGQPLHLAAQGNQFSGGVKCTAGAPVLTTNGAQKTCSGAKDVGTSSIAFAILDVTTCSY